MGTSCLVGSNYNVEDPELGQTIGVFSPPATASFSPIKITQQEEGLLVSGNCFLSLLYPKWVVSSEKKSIFYLVKSEA